MRGRSGPATTNLEGGREKKTDRQTDSLTDVKTTATLNERKGEKQTLQYKRENGWSTDANRILTNARPPPRLLSFSAVYSFGASQRQKQGPG
mmetsp:Transcript_39301/g.77322  ORF Transcript_39301/g.77322 Transcript_39301/m.77322 type:complete len:92 (-) Transcript_39301:395-670(-)